MSEFDFGAYKKKKKKDEPKITTTKGDASPIVEEKRQRKPRQQRVPSINIEKLIEDTTTSVLKKVQSFNKNEELRIKYSTWTWKELYNLSKKYDIKKINEKYTSNCTATEILSEIISFESKR